MTNRLIRQMALLGGVSILAILTIQGFWLRQTYSLKDSEFHRTVSIALFDVAEKIAEFNEADLPKQNLIQRQSSNIYAVNINDVIDPNILEDYLIRIFTERALQTDFEYAVYDCLNKELVYGNYCKLTDRETPRTIQGNIPKFDDLIYYFVVRFPSRNSWLIGQLWQNALLGVATLFIIAFFIYSMWLILHQKKMSELQKDFINNMTHEFRTPITSIKIAARALHDTPIIAGNDRLIKYTEIITEQNDRLNLQVEKVLNLAKLEGDNFKLNCENLELISVLDKIITSQQIKMQESDEGNVRLVTDVVRATIFADKLHFSNSIYSLLDNAVKYCKEVPEVTVNVVDAGKTYRISVIDNGIGIEKENVAKLFTKFYRVPTGNLHNVKGFGLGLFYVKSIIDSHGWEIEVESNPEKGSTFTIVISKSHEQ